MAFSMSNASGGPDDNFKVVPTVQDLPEVMTESLSFSAINQKGVSKLKLLPSPWPTNALPPPTSTLLAIAPHKGILAAAGPDALYIASTQKVRETLQNKAEPGSDALFTPELSIPVPRLSQIAFTSNEEFLVICAESGGGLAVHHVGALLKNNTDPAFQIGTNGVGVRALAPNPAPEAAHSVAVVLENGHFMIADLNGKSFMTGPTGAAALKDNVSCVSWSNKGKQISAGMGDGTVIQMKPDGSVQATVPKVPGLDGDFNVSGLLWLANEDWLTIHTPNSFDADAAPESFFHIVHRDKANRTFAFSKLAEDPAHWYGMNRSPPHHFLARLRNFKPTLDDVVIVANTAGLDVGLIAKSSAALSPDTPVTDVYTTVTIGQDSRRAQLPTSALVEMEDTSPVGMALDLSSTDVVQSPILGSEIEFSQTPLPAVMVLNHEGYLNAWWFIYNASIEQGVAYDGLPAAAGQTLSQPTASTQNTPSLSNSMLSAPAASASGTPAFGASTFGAPGTSPFGNPSAVGGNKSPWGGSTGNAQTGGATFGQPSFGSSSALGAKPAFGSASSLGAKPAFGSASSLGAKPPAFGSAGGLGNKSSPWGSSGGAGAQAPSKIPTPFGSAVGTGTESSPFGKLASSASPFSNLAGKSSGESAFGKAQNTQGSSTFGSASTFGQPAATPNQSFGMTNDPSFGSTVSLNSSGGSTIKSFNTPGPSFGTPGGSTFGQSSFGAPRAEVPKDHESDMGDADDQPAGEENEATDKDKPKEQPKPNLFGLPKDGFKVGSTFKGETGEKEDSNSKPSDADSGSFGLGSSFGQALGDSASKSPKTPLNVGFGFGQSPDKAKEASTTPSSGPAETPKPSGGFFNYKPSGNSLFGTPGTNGTSPSAPTPAPSGLFGGLGKSKSPTPASVTPAAKDKTPTPQPEDAPLPPDFTKPSKPAEKQDELPPLGGSPPPLAGSPGVEVERPDSPGLSEIASEDGSEDEESEGPNGQLKDGDRAGKEAKSPVFSPPASKTPNAWNFGGLPSLEPGKSSNRAGSRSPPKSRSPSRSPVRAPSRSLFGNGTTPAAIPPGQMFPRPPEPELPRSPSPFRSASTSVIPTGPRRQAVTIPPNPPVTRPAPRPSAPPEPEPVLPDFEDEEAELSRQILESEPEPKRKIGDFYLHVDRPRKGDKDSVAASIEELYRDVQSMVDTLGLNAHTVEGFVAGNMQNDQQRTREDLDQDPEDEDGWTLAEIPSLSEIESSVGKSLDEGSITDVREKLADLQRLHKDALQLAKSMKEIRKVIDARKDPSKAGATKAAALTENQSMQQTSLRSSYAETHKLLARAEEEVVMLRARISTLEASKNGTGAGPTAEAVESTIRKMTAMVQTKSADLDVLEQQMRNLGMHGADTTDGDADDDLGLGLGSLSLSTRTASGSVGSRDSTPFATPRSTRKSPGPGSALRTPGSARSKRGFGYSYGDSDAGSPAPVRSVELDEAEAGESGVSSDEVGKFQAKLAKRAQVARQLRRFVARDGTRVTACD